MLSIDEEEGKDAVSRFVREYGLSYENLIDETGEVGALYGVRSTPMKFLIDTEGNLVGAALGYSEWNDDRMKQLINKLIEAG